MQMISRGFVSVAALACLAGSGCILGSRPQFVGGGSDDQGAVYYLDGAGNMGFGKETVPLGLADAGYQGAFHHFIWTSYLGISTDQTWLTHNRKQGRRLATKIEAHLNKYPNAEVNIIALSAGTGVAVWALEALPTKYQVNQVIMLSSSLSSTYDLSRALRRVRGGMYFYYSTDDPVLNGVVPLFGSVDQTSTTVAGVTGARIPHGAGAQVRQLYQEKVHNVQWQAETLQLRHAGTTERGFIRDMVAPILVGSSRAPASRRTD